MSSEATVEDVFTYRCGWFLEPGANGAFRLFYHDGGDGTLAIAFPEGDAIVILLARHFLPVWVAPRR